MHLTAAPAAAAVPVAIQRPFFLPGEPGRLFAIYHQPLGDAPPWGNVLVVPPFNEEMNRCRSLVTLQAQALARVGVGTLVIDLYGTGESDGEHGDARWDLWCDNVRQGIAWLDGQDGGCSGVLAIRLGVPLALSALRDSPTSRALIAWQPVVDGRTYFTQFMRARIAANMDRNDIAKETTAAMRARIDEGKAIEVVGYEIHPALARAIDGVKLVELPPAAAMPVAWFEKANASETALPPASEKVVAAWRESGLTIVSATFDDPAFWALHDRTPAPGLLAMTTDWIRTWRSAR